MTERPVPTTREPKWPHPNQILSHMHPKGSYPGQLADEFDVSRPYMLERLEELEALGFARREVRPFGVGGMSTIEVWFAGPGLERSSADD